MIITINDDIYIVNVGDSRAIGSRYFGKDYFALSTDHKPSDPKEFERIL